MEKINNNHCIYIHTNLINNKVYVGQTTGSTYEECNYTRWKSGEGYKGQDKFYNAIKKYGWNGFKHDIIATGLSQEDANQRESYYIGKYNSFDNGYNDTIGGAGNRKPKRSLLDVIQESLDNKEQYISAKNSSFICGKRVHVVTAFSELDKCDYTLIDFEGWTISIHWHTYKSISVYINIDKGTSTVMKNLTTQIQNALISIGYFFEVDLFYKFYKDLSIGTPEFFCNEIVGHREK